MRLTTQLLKRWHPMSVKFANLPESFIKRKMEQVYYKTPNKVNYLPRKIERKKFTFGSSRPWDVDFYFQNAPGKFVPVKHVEPIAEWSFFRGDRVQILVGRDKGKQGLVTKIVAERNWVYVRGLNTTLHRMGKEGNYPGFYESKEAPLLVTTDIQLVDPSDLEPTTIEWRHTVDGQRVRVSTRTQRIIPIPISAEMTKDYQSPMLYKDKPVDTPKEEVEKITFKPALKTFEMDIMEKMGIVEDRVPKKYWWY